MRNKTFKCSKLLLFKKKNQDNMVKNLKNFPHKLNNLWFWTIFYVFHHVNLDLKKNNKSLEYLNVLLRIFFVRCVFQKFYVDFCFFTKGGKSDCPLKQFWRKKKVSSKFYYLSSIWIYKLSASRITENSTYCYPRNIRTKCFRKLGYFVGHCEHTFVDA